MKIIARKPRHPNDPESTTENIVVEHYNGEFVSATTDAHSLDHDSFFWGHYFKTREEALAHFDKR
jgi:hypothetical protein